MLPGIDTSLILLFHIGDVIVVKHVTDLFCFFQVKKSCTKIIPWAFLVAIFVMPFYDKESVMLQVTVLCIKLARTKKMKKKKKRKRKRNNNNNNNHKRLQQDHQQNHQQQQVLSTTTVSGNDT